MKTVMFTRALGLGVTAALAATALQLSPASAAPSPTPLTLTVASQDGPFFQTSDYATGDITVQVENGAGAFPVDPAQDLTYSWDYTSFASGATPVKVPTTGDSVQATDVKGKFVVALPVSQGPGTYTLSAALPADANGDNAVAAPDLVTFTVGNAAPAGSTAKVTGLADGKPGLAQTGVVTVTDPAGDPIAKQVFTLDLDHGFFTTGDSSTAAGTPVGNLTKDGTKLTGITDSSGRLEFVGGKDDFQVGIARDTGFDDDGLVATSVKVGGVTTSGTAATWDSATPLNGDVAVRLSPAAVQENPVNPTLAGNRAFYDVFALDQFGNPVAGNDDGLPDTEGDDIVVDLEFSNERAGFDYDDNAPVANLTSYGDFYVYSELPGTVGITGTWQDAPTTTFGPSGTPAVRGSDDAVATASASTYELNFTASSFSMTSSVAGTVRIGTAVTQTVRVVDQLGNPVSGYDVRFLRYAPDEQRGEVVATRSTNALGLATYTFIGTAPGRSTITAEVTDGLRRRELTSRVDFGRVVRAKLAKTKGSASGRGADRLTVTTRVAAPGARVQLYKIVKGKQRYVGARTLNRKGQATFSVRDRNRSARTTYVAEVRSTTKTVADRSNTAKLR